MKVKVISPTIQEFNGERYYSCGKYYQHGGKRLHRAVWEYHNGEIPKGYHVHHKDGNVSNNQLENLMLLDPSYHLSLHGKDPQKFEYQHRHIKEMQEQAKEWHRSEEGREWHRKHGKDTWQAHEQQTYICSFCGKEFQTLNVYGDHQNRFCSNKCRAAFRRASGVDDEDRTCEYCGKTFRANKYTPNKFCSVECARKKRWNK